MTAFLRKRSNQLWYWLIRQRLTATVWRGLVEWTERRQVRFRRELEAAEIPAERQPAGV